MELLGRIQTTAAIQVRKIASTALSLSSSILKTMMTLTTTLTTLTTATATTSTFLYLVILWMTSQCALGSSTSLHFDNSNNNNSNNNSNNNNNNNSNNNFSLPRFSVTLWVTSRCALRPFPLKKFPPSFGAQPKDVTKKVDHFTNIKIIFFSYKRV